MKTALPENAKIAKEAKECMQECVSEFISFITSEGLHTLFHHDNRLPDLNLTFSLGEMPTREEEDGQWRRHPIRYDVYRFRELR